MTTLTGLLVLVLVAGTQAGPTYWPREGAGSLCSMGCRANDPSKLRYEINKPYVYSYAGTSRIQLKDVHEGQTESRWSAQVELTWLSPCDMAITMKGFNVEGATKPADSSILEKYPLVVALNNGRVEHVCIDPHDERWSINLKKGVASTIQNSLPSFTSTTPALNVTETDVVGKCLTEYTVESEGDMKKILKVKNHKMCQERFLNQAETPVLWLQGPLPIQEGKTVCEQEIHHGIYTRIVCRDKNVIRPNYGAYKYVVAIQESTLQYQPDSSRLQADASHYIIPASTAQNHRSLLYDHDVPKADQPTEEEIDHAMMEICEKTKDYIMPDAASAVAKAVRLLRRMPEDAAVKILEKISAGGYGNCANIEKLKDLFLDIVAFVPKPGAVKIIVDKLKNGEATGVRSVLYAAALYLYPRPCIHAIKELKPLFQLPEPTPLPTLAAASMVNKYCRHHPDCSTQPPVQELVVALSSHLNDVCSPSSDPQRQMSALTVLKALGNMGVMTEEASKSVFDCLEKGNVKTNIRVAAAQAFRQAKCNSAITERLVSVAMAVDGNTEVSIASYLMAIPCAQQKDLNNIVAQISQERNTQVRGFILSHLVNLQETNAPFKEYLRQLLANTRLPINFSKDIRRYSRNIDLSYFNQSLGVGAEMESNIIYAPGSYLPRAVDFNLTAALRGEPINIGEVGARLEGLDPIISELFGPEGYFQHSDYSTIFNDVIRFVQEVGTKIIGHVQNEMRQKRSIDFQSIFNFLGRNYGSETPRSFQADIFARFLGQEIFFAALPWDTKDLTAEKLAETLSSYYDHLQRYIQNLEHDTVRAAQLFLDYSIPTIHGTPLKLQLEGTAVVGLQMQIPNERNSGRRFKIIPGVSVETVAFIGYGSFLSKTGIKMNSTVSSSSGASVNVKAMGDKEVEFEWEYPPIKDLVSVRGQTYLMRSVRGNPEERITPRYMRDIRTHKYSCIDSLQTALGLKLCLDMNIPDVVRSNSLPLGQPAVINLNLEKAEPNIRALGVKAAIENEGERKVLAVHTEVVGSSTPRKSGIVLALHHREDSSSASANVYSPSVSSEANASILYKEHKSSETYLDLRLNEAKISKGLKVHFQPTSGINERGYSLSVYTSNSRHFDPASPIIEGKYVEKGRGSQVYAEAYARTRNALRDYLPLNLEVETDLHYTPYHTFPVPKNVQKFEFNAGVGGRNMTIVHKAEAGEVHHLLSYKPAQSDDMLLLGYKQRHDQNGISNTATVKIGNLHWKAHHEVDHGYGKRETSQTLSLSGRNIVELEAALDHQLPLYTATLRAEWPEYMRRVEFKGILGKERNKYVGEAGLKHGDRNILHVSGQLQAAITPESHKIKSDMNLAFLAGNPYKLSSSISVANNEQIVSFDIQNQERIFALNWNMKPSSSYVPNVALNLVIPHVIEKDLTILAERNVHVTLNSHLLPQSSRALRVKGYTDIDLDNHELKVNLAWDADREERKVAIDAHMKHEPRYPGNAYLRGTLKYLNEIYEADLDAEASNLLINGGGENGFKFLVRTPSQKTLALETRSNIQHQSSNTRVTVNTHYKTLENKTYKVDSTTDWERLGDPYSFKNTHHVVFTPPRGRETSVRTEVKHMNSQGKREKHYQATVTSPVLDKPLYAHLSTVSEVNSHKIEANTGVENPTNMFKGHLKFYPQGGISSLASAVDVGAIDTFLQTVHKLASHGRHDISAIPSHQRVRGQYNFQYQKPSPSTYSVLLQYPSRTVQAEAVYSPTQASLTFYPNLNSSEAKYEVGLRSSYSYWHQQSTYQGHVHHPRLTKDLQGQVQYAVNGDNVNGKFELDLFPDAADKITGEFQSRRNPDNSIKTEGTLKTRMLKVSPTITIVSALSSHTFDLDVQLKKTPTSPKILQMITKYDQSPNREAQVVFTITALDRTVVNTSAQLKPQKAADCHGWEMNALIRNEVLAPYVIQSRLCEQATSQLIIKKQGSEKQFKLELDHKHPTRVEVSVSERDQKLAKGRVHLANPNLLVVDVIRGREEMENIKEAVRKEWRKVVDFTYKWVSSVFANLEQEVQLQGIHPSTSELVQAREDVVQELSNIYQELIHDVTGGQYGDMNHSGPSSWPYVTHLYNRLSAGQQHIGRNLPILPSLEGSEGYFNGLVDLISDGLWKIVHWMEETIGIRDTLWKAQERLNQSRIVTLAANKIESLKAAYPEEFEAIVQFLNKVWFTLEEDLEMIQQMIMRIPVVENIIHWIREHFTSADEGYFSKLVQDAVSAHWKNEGDHFVMKIPLPKPVYSLTQILLNMAQHPWDWFGNPSSILWQLLPTPVKNMEWAYNNLLSRRVTDQLPPFSGTAVVGGDTEILTFDGAVLHVPRSPCEVLLAAYNTTTLTMSHPQHSAPPRITLITGRTNVTVKPDFTVMINGQAMTGTHKTVGNVTVNKTHQEITIMSPYMTVRVMRILHVMSVNASGWTFGRLVGLLGTYDGEVGNDWMMPSGRKASNLQELVRSWQKDPLCHTPAVSPVRATVPSEQRVAQCLRQLENPSRCYPAVHPEHFMKVCSDARGAYDAAQAYDIMCSAQGVKPRRP